MRIDKLHSCTFSTVNSIDSSLASITACKHILDTETFNRSIWTREFIQYTYSILISLITESNNLCTNSSFVPTQLSLDKTSVQHAIRLQLKIYSIVKSVISHWLRSPFRFWSDFRESWTYAEFLNRFFERVRIEPHYWVSHECLIEESYRRVIYFVWSMNCSVTISHKRVIKWVRKVTNLCFIPIVSLRSSQDAHVKYISYTHLVFPRMKNEPTCRFFLW